MKSLFYKTSYINWVEQTGQQIDDPDLYLRYSLFKPLQECQLFCVWCIIQTLIHVISSHMINPGSCLRSRHVKFSTAT